jgi:class 3 adenylate cyclase
VLATVLFIEIVRSTERAAALGDQEWKEIIVIHNDQIRKNLARYGGREIKTTGDGFLATFDAPGRAIRAPRRSVSLRARSGLEIRAGLHAGEVELMEDEVAGIAVHIGARIAALVGSSEVLVSDTVKDLVVGSGIEFVALHSGGGHYLDEAPQLGKIQLRDLAERGGQTITQKQSRDGACKQARTDHVERAAE